MKGVWRPSDRAASRYHYVPIEVPAGGCRVVLDYDRQAGVIDLGLFSASGEFRGYSGGARDWFTVTPDWATPGYLPGPLAEAQVFLGLHRIPPAGLEWSLSVEAPSDRTLFERPIAPPRPPRRDLPALDGLRWFAGDLHAHTVHSDGSLTIDELAAQAVGEGLDFLAVTDHNTVSHHPFLAGAGHHYGFTLIPGQEVTTDSGHANAFGGAGWVDFRHPASDWPGLLSINHPLAADCAWRHPLNAKPPLAEIWHSGWRDRTWGAPIAWLLAWDPATAPVGGSDFHGPDQTLGRPTTWVLAPSPSTDDLLAGLAAGRTAISDSPGGPLLLRHGTEFLALDADGLLLTTFDRQRHLVRGNHWLAPAKSGPHWLEDHHTRIAAICA